MASSPHWTGYTYSTKLCYHNLYQLTANIKQVMYWLIHLFVLILLIYFTHFFISICNCFYISYYRINGYFAWLSNFLTLCNWIVVQNIQFLNCRLLFRISLVLKAFSSHFNNNNVNVIWQLCKLLYQCQLWYYAGWHVTISKGLFTNLIMYRTVWFSVRKQFVW